LPGQVTALAGTCLEAATLLTTGEVAKKILT
jgi:hypothetical protein